VIYGETAVGFVPAIFVLLAYAVGVTFLIKRANHSKTTLVATE
jgi:hypothetical protein